MVGFIKGFFGGKKVEADVTPKPEKPVQQADTSKAFFLEPDDAKTFGNIDYMRSVKAIKRTFPKTKGNGGEFEVVQQISAMGKMELAEMGVAPVEPVRVQDQATGSVGEATAPSTSVSEPVSDVGDRRTTDSNLDMFRSMARDLKKR